MTEAVSIEYLNVTDRQTEFLYQYQLAYIVGMVTRDKNVIFKRLTLL